ncbi:MAG TPA: hypothetical protein VIG78_05880, partial [Gemmatimonadaceae bacterium]
MSVRIFETATLKFVGNLGPALRVFPVDFLDPRSTRGNSDHQRALCLDRTYQFGVGHVLVDAAALYKQSKLHQETRVFISRSSENSAITPTESLPQY